MSLEAIPVEPTSTKLGSNFEAVFDSAEIGWTKPNARAFQHVLDSLQLAPREVFFTDDSARKLIGAETLGIPIHHFTVVTALRDALTQ
ncbi:hypothetical protein BMW26_01050 [Microbacterium sp. 1.5R]|uniref:HAD hydrolase-like protein n=1 Tax=Microbacterium sp. 1.5R TaxID=1916917 RepID=UPI00090AC9AC|nr:HAD hydrolase-like protein [Microbacterium sp. 1.5R]APH43700.1 hypothetical protein BMW26_01050 [Microbacterium sp. 1.5R]